MNYINGGSIMIIFQQQITNDELEKKLNQNNIVILDVRETEEYSAAHIPGSVLIPLGQLADRYHELDAEEEIYVICRSGARSNEACHILTANGFKRVFNVVPGMCEWTGPIDSIYE